MMTDDEFESRILRFETAWRLQGPPEIDDYLKDPFDSPAPRRDDLLVELICIDLEYRWRNARAETPASLARYLEKFPELISLDQLPLELIAEEYRARQQWGDRPSHAEFMSPLQERRERIRAELLRVDQEIEEELVVLESDSEPPLRDSPTGYPAIVEPDIQLLSHCDFLLKRLIGAGRMGKVYQARRLSDGLDVAVQFVRKPLLRHPDVVRRFLGEALTIAGLRHPNIIGTQGLGRTPGGSYFMVMDLVAGSDLARLASGRAITEGETVGWMMEICDALSHAHGRGIVLCDLKPANILLDQSGRIRVADFGLARSLTGGAAWAVEVEGTAPFMAPEQVCRSWGPIDQRTDVYGIGAVLFALLTGRAPHVGSRLPDILAAVVASTPVISPSRFRPGL